VAGAWGWQPYCHLWVDVTDNTGSLTSLNPVGPHGLLRGYFYFFTFYVKIFRSVFYFILFIYFAEKRDKYDNGEDPLDPETQGSQGFNPFHPHFHGSPFQFKFHFNWEWRTTRNLLLYTDQSALNFKMLTVTRINQYSGSHQSVCLLFMAQILWPEGRCIAILLCL
jgi:hypothetical protein